MEFPSSKSSIAGKGRWKIKQKKTRGGEGCREVTMSVKILAKPTSAEKKEKKCPAIREKLVNQRKIRKCFFSTTSGYFFFEMRQVLKENYNTGLMRNFTHFRVFGS